ncbi:M50 family metallopeptidase [Clostridium oryzae]|uniref:Stage IV sporulation protein FB n=1 Tax=Clostridium oryzae TaxID=1450648 RepID=A0A1V4IV32_9CLOT|nr:M50 family metallopeptidase [Clostridium oryzae]OPJ63763.1 stage IV sporulation protein FB [Clostridium oryzae]
MIKLNKFFIPYILLLIIIGFEGQLFLAFIMVLMHETVHYIAAVLLGYSGFDVTILPIGAVLSLREIDEASPIEDLIISISGPIFNIVVAVAAYYLELAIGFGNLKLFIETNITLGLFNLIPAFPLDGGRILRDIFSIKMVYRKANKLTVNISIILGFLILSCFIFLFFCGHRIYNIGIIAVFIIISSYKEKERIAYIIMGDIVKKKERFIRKKYVENKYISVHCSIDLLGIMSLVDKNKYCIFTILDDDMKVMYNLFEEDLIDALKIYGNISAAEYVERMKESSD